MFIDWYIDDKFMYILHVDMLWCDNCDGVHDRVCRGVLDIYELVADMGYAWMMYVVEKWSVHACI